MGQFHFMTEPTLLRRRPPVGSDGNADFLLEVWSRPYTFLTAKFAWVPEGPSVYNHAPKINYGSSEAACCC